MFTLETLMAQKNMRRHSCFAIVTKLTNIAVASVAIHSIIASVAVLTRVAGTLVLVYKILRIYSTIQFLNNITPTLNIFLVRITQFYFLVRINYPFRHVEITYKQLNISSFQFHKTQMPSTCSFFRFQAITFNRNIK